MSASSAMQKALEERLEKRLRTFMKTEEENKRCFNCASLGPSYVVLVDGQGAPLNVFVCTQCSGVHRTAQHRVKSVTAAKFSEDEVEKICEKGGNRRAREVLLANWDSSLQRRPAQSLPKDIQEWIDAVFVRKRFKGEPKPRVIEPEPERVIVMPKQEPAPAPVPAPLPSPAVVPAQPVPPPQVQLPAAPQPSNFFSFDSPAKPPAPQAANGGHAGFFDPFGAGPSGAAASQHEDNWANFDDHAAAQPAPSGFTPFDAQPAPQQAASAPAPAQTGWADFGASTPATAPHVAPFGQPQPQASPPPQPLPSQTVQPSPPASAPPSGNNELFDLFNAPAAPQQSVAASVSHNPFDDPSPAPPAAPSAPFGAPQQAQQANPQHAGFGAPVPPQQQMPPQMPSQATGVMPLQPPYGAAPQGAPFGQPLPFAPSTSYGVPPQMAPQYAMPPQMMGGMVYPSQFAVTQQQQMMMQQPLYLNQDAYLRQQQMMGRGVPQQQFGGPFGGPLPFGAPPGGVNSLAALPPLPGVQAVPPASSFGLTNSEKLNKNLFKDLAPNLNTMGLASKPAVAAPAAMQKPMSSGVAMKGPAAAAMQQQKQAAPSQPPLPNNFSAGNPFAD